MKRSCLLFFLLFVPLSAYAAMSGIDDVTPNLSPADQVKIDNAMTTYYLHPSVDKVNTVLDIMAAGEMVRKKTAWAPLISFLSVVFADNKNHVMRWISRNDYNIYAQDIIVAALMQAKLHETALVFAQASQWKDEDIDRIRNYHEDTDYKHLAIILPGHIDALWGVFFASGDPVYVSEIIHVLFMTSLPHSDTVTPPDDEDVLGENKALARYSLAHYAASDSLVRSTLKKQISAARTPQEKQTLEKLLPSGKKIAH
jgi:hypothetical protein